MHKLGHEQNLCPIIFQLLCSNCEEGCIYIADMISCLKAIQIPK